MDTASPILVTLFIGSVVLFFGMATYGAIWLPWTNAVAVRRIKREREEAEKKAEAKKAARQQAISDSVKAAVEEGSLSWGDGHRTIVDGEGTAVYTFMDGEFKSPADLEQERKREEYKKSELMTRMAQAGHV